VDAQHLPGHQPSSANATPVEKTPLFFQPNRPPNPSYYGGKLTMAPFTVPLKDQDWGNCTRVSSESQFASIPHHLISHYTSESEVIEKLTKEVADLKRQLAVSNRELFQLRNRRR
jgi:hypothetical protein